MDMKEWLNGLRKAERKKAMPILSFPAVQLMGISVRELISDSDRQAEGMQRIAERVDAAASYPTWRRSRTFRSLPWERDARTSISMRSERRRKKFRTGPYLQV